MFGRSTQMRDKDLQNIQKFLAMSRGHIKNINARQEYQHPDVRLWNTTATAMYEMHSRTVNVVEMECDMELLARVIERFVEFEQLMSDPECRHMINEAKFISNLKYGKRYEL